MTSLTILKGFKMEVARAVRLIGKGGIGKCWKKSGQRNASSLLCGQEVSVRSDRISESVGIGGNWRRRRILNRNNCNVNYYGGSYFCMRAGFQSYAVLNKDMNPEQEAVKGEKVLRVKLPSTRVDAILKAGLGMSRNKIEKAIYDDRIRVNGVRPKKKSVTADEGDEIDLVRGYNQLNPDFIDVSRVEVDELGEDEGSDSDASDSDSEDVQSSKIPAVLRRSKLLTIKNYSPPWKGKSGDD